MTQDDQRFLDACALVRKFVPGYRAVMKADSRLMRAIGRVFGVFGSKSFMSDFWTTFRGVTYRPSACADGATTDEFLVIMHEGRHAVDRARMGWLFDAGYLLPQLLAVPGALCALFGACLASGGLAVLGLLLLALAAPLPAPFRAWAEFRGYDVTLACTVWAGKMGDANQFLDQFLAPLFTGPAYFYMWPFKARVRKHFEDTLAAVIDKTVGLKPFADDYEAACFELAQRYRAEDVQTQPTA